MGSFLAVLQRFGLGRLIAILGAAAGAVAVLVGVMMHVGGEPESLLYSNLDLKEASEIATSLAGAGIKYETKGDGSVITVPRDKVGAARLLLASKGLPTSGSVGYEIFDSGSALGQTDFVQNLNRQRALEGELARTIRSLRGVTSARVHLVLPKRQLFEEEAAAPTASIVVGAGGRDLSSDQVRALRNLVAGAVPNLKPDRVTVVDENNKLLAAGGDDAGEAGEAAGAERKAQVEERLRHAIKDVVEGVVGPGKARVQVTADIDQKRVTTQEEKYDPDGSVVLSTSTGAEKSSDNAAGSTGGATAGANFPGAATGGPGSPAQGTSNDKNQETTNYALSKTVRTEIDEPGAVKRLSVAVAVDGLTTVGKGGKVTYAPRSAEEMQRIQDLVRSAMGFDDTRKDQISVVNVRFNRNGDGLEGTAAKPPLFDFDKNDILRGIELLILAVVGVLVVLFVLRPMMKAGSGGGLMLAPMGSPAGGGAPLLASHAAGQAAPQLAFSGAEALALAGPSEMDQRIDIARIEGQVKLSSIKKVADFVDKHPDESVSILRSWLHES